MDLDTFETSHSLSGMDLLDTDVFFSTEQLGVSELDMAGLTDVDLSHLDNNLAGADHNVDSEHWSESVADLDLNPSDLVNFGSADDSSEADTSNQGADSACLDDDFQRMLTDWESHIGSLSAGAESVEDTADQDSLVDQSPETPEMMSPSSPAVSVVSAPVRQMSSVSQPRQLPVSLRTQIVPRPGVTYTRVGAGPFPRLVTNPGHRISHLHASTSPTSPPHLQVRSRVSLVSKDWQVSGSSTALPDSAVKFSNDLSRTLENQKKRMQWLETNLYRSSSSGSAGVRPRVQQNNNNSSVKIIAAVSPGKNGQSTTRILSTRHDTLPRELIEKIKAASQGRKTIAIIEPINKTEKPLPSNFTPSQPSIRSKSSVSSVSSGWPGQSPGGKWRHVGIVNPLQSQNISSDHDYCSPTKSSSPPAPVKYTKVIRSSSPGVKDQSSRGRDSGLESDGSDNSEDGALYDKLPPYLTSVSVQTTGHEEEEDSHYSRVPYYMTTLPSVQQQQSSRQSLLKYNSHPQIKQENIILTHPGDTADTGDTGDNVGEDGRGSSSEREVEQKIVLKQSRKRSISREKVTRSAGVKYRRLNTHQRTKIWRNNDPEQHQQRKQVVEERKIVYVGKIEEGTLRADLRSRFEKFGPILDVSIHFRERGDNYGFITFANREDAYEAVEHGNDDRSLPIYDLCFGGRRDFCKEKYFDMDFVEEKKTGDDLDFDSLLQAARVNNDS